MTNGCLYRVECHSGEVAYTIDFDVFDIRGLQMVPGTTALLR